MKRILAALAFAMLTACQAFGQAAVLQSGAITPGHGVQWLANGIVSDTGQPWNSSSACNTTGCTFTGAVTFGDGLTVSLGTITGPGAFGVDANGNVTGLSLNLNSSQFTVSSAGAVNAVGAITAGGNVAGVAFVSGIATGLSAAGASQATATPLGAQQVQVVSTVNSGTGVVLSSNVPIGGVETVVNAGANSLSLYPPSGDQIDGQGANVAIQVPVCSGTCGTNSAGGTATLLHVASGTWRSIAGANVETVNGVYATHSITSGGYFAGSIATSLTAAGNSQATAYNLTTETGGEYNVFSTVAAGTGTALASQTPYGAVNAIYNEGANALLVYPPIGSNDQIDGLGAGAALSVPAGSYTVVLHDASGDWRTTAGVSGQGGTSNVVSNTLTATGSTQSGAYALAANSTYNVFTTVASGTGAVLNSTTPYGQIVTVMDAGANSLNLYPPSGDAIDGNSANAPIAVPNCASGACGTNPGQGTATVLHVASGVWRSVAGANLETFNGLTVTRSISDLNGYIGSSYVSGLTATGTSLSTAYDLAQGEEIDEFDTVPSGTGAKLGTNTGFGSRNVVINRGANALLVYPPDTSSEIDGLVAGTAVTVPATCTASFIRMSATDWRTGAYACGNGSIVVSGSVTASGNGSIGGNLSVTGAATLSGGGTFSGTIAGTPTFSGAVTFSGQPDFSGATLFSVPFQIQPTTVSALPTCNSSTKGDLTAVSDASSPTYNATLTGGSTTFALALCNGTNWTAH